ncbi:MAG: translation initiation factor IF-2 N-terminal domain-containing protein, partial [Anaerolineales bacterium]|nr:translation initiation factor IF-2 N-terminal domain-containing protein [Anaerolineales bacterium]
MSNIMVKDLASTVGITAERLVEQLNKAGINVSKPDQQITEEQKQTLLSFLQDRYENLTDSTIVAPKKITLKR